MQDHGCEATGHAVCPDIEGPDAGSFALSHAVHDFRRRYRFAGQVLMDSRHPRPGNIAFGASGCAATAGQQWQAMAHAHTGRERDMPPFSGDSVTSGLQVATDAVAAYHSRPQGYPDHALVPVGRPGVRFGQGKGPAIIDDRNRPLQQPYQVSSCVPSRKAGHVDRQ